MRISQLPPDAIDRLVALDQHADALAKAAVLADARLAECRATLAGDFRKTGIVRTDREVMERAQREFASIHEASQETRRRADAARRVATGCKAFVDGLRDDAVIELLAVPKANGVDLSECRGRIAKLRGEITKIRNAPLPAPDIRERVGAYVDRLAHHGRPLLRGFHAGGELHVSWPMSIDVNRQNGSGFDDRQGNALLMTAIFQPAALRDYLLAEIEAETDKLMPAAERGPRLAELESQLAQLQSLEVTFVNARIESGDAGVTFDPATPAAVILGIKLAL